MYILKLKSLIDGVRFSKWNRRQTRLTKPASKYVDAPKCKINFKTTPNKRLPLSRSNALNRILAGKRVFIHSSFEFRTKWKTPFDVGKFINDLLGFPREFLWNCPQFLLRQIFNYRKFLLLYVKIRIEIIVLRYLI